MNKQTQLLQNSLPMIGAGLGDKLGVRITVTGNQAFTNGSEINIPSFEIQSKDDKNAVLGYMAHEAAHIKFNSHKGINQVDCQEPFRKALWNICEDLRIEKAMIEHMVGSRKWIDQIWINRQREGKRLPVTKDAKPQTIIADYMLFTCRYKYRNQANLEPFYDAAEDAFVTVLGYKLLMKLNQLIHPRLDKLTSSVEAMELAKDIEHLFLSHDPSEEDSQSQDDSNSDDSSNDDSNSNDSEESESDGNDDSTDDSESDSDAENGQSDGDGDSSESSNGTEQGDTDNQSGDQSSVKSEPSASASSREQPSAEDVFKALSSLLSAIDDDFQDDMQNFASQMETLSNANGDRTNVKMPIEHSVDGKHSTSTSQALSAKVKQTSNAITGKLIGLVQEHQRVTCKTAKSGRRLNSRVLHRASIGDDRLFKTKSEQKQIDTIVEIAIDNSSSMDYDDLIEPAKEAQLALAMALSKINGVSVTASAFPYKHDGKVLKLLSEGENVRNLANRLNLVHGDVQSTPSATAMLYCLKTVLQSSHSKKVVLFITDGVPNLSERDELTRLVQKAEKSGVTVIGIAIGAIANDKDYFYRYFSNAIFIQNMKELKTEMFRLAKNILI